MSLKGSHTEAEPIEWGDVDILIKCAICNKMYDTAALIVAEAYYGLKFQDVINLTWDNVLSEEFIVTKEKSKKVVTICNNKEAIEYFKLIINAKNITDKDKKICLNTYGGVSTLQNYNKNLKKLKYYSQIVKIEHFTTESLRKTFGRHVYDILPDDMKISGLEMLSDYFGHVSSSFTRKYIGIKEDAKFKSPFEVFAVVGTNTKSLDDNFLEKYRKPSYVYIMKDENIPNVIKIGKSNNPSKREETLQAEKPTIVLFKCIKLGSEDSAYAFEKMLHKKYWKNHKRGEWFNFTDEELKNLLNDYCWEDYIEEF